MEMLVKGFSGCPGTVTDFNIGLIHEPVLLGNSQSVDGAYAVNPSSVKRNYFTLDNIKGAIFDHDNPFADEGVT